MSPKKKLNSPVSILNQKSSRKLKSRKSKYQFKIKLFLKLFNRNLLKKKNKIKSKKIKNTNAIEECGKRECKKKWLSLLTKDCKY